MMSGGTENSNDDDNIMSPALAIGVILDKVFAKLGTSALKSVRLVCHLWSDVASGHLGKKTILDLKKMLPSAVVLTEPPQLNPKLAKQVQVDECYKDEKGEVKKDASFGHNFDLVVPLFCNIVEKISLRVDGSGPFVPHFISVLQQNDFSKLKEISIEYIQRAVIVPNNGAMTNYDVSNIPQLNFRALPSLKFIAINAVHHGDPIVLEKDRDYDEGCVKFRSILPAMLAAAENLEELEISDVFCPNLASCNKLKALKYNQRFNRKEVNFRMPAITRTLISVKDSLEKFDLNVEIPLTDYGVDMDLELIFFQFYILRLALYRGTAPPQTSLQLNIPEMANLTSLTLREVHEFQLVRGIDQRLVPKPKQLIILGERWFKMNLGAIQKLLWTRDELVTSLQLGLLSFIPDDTIPILDNLTSIFPSVKTFQMGFDLNVFKTNQLTRLKEIVATFHAWDLTRLELKFLLVEVGLISVVVESLITLEALKTISFYVGKDSTSLSLLSSEEVKAALISCKGLERVSISLDETDNYEVMDEMEAFVFQHKLPIEFQWPRDLITRNGITKNNNRTVWCLCVRQFSTVPAALLELATKNLLSFLWPVVMTGLLLFTS